MLLGTEMQYSIPWFHCFYWAICQAMEHPPRRSTLNIVELVFKV